MLFYTVQYNQRILLCTEVTVKWESKFGVEKEGFFCAISLHWKLENISILRSCAGENPTNEPPWVMPLESVHSFATENFPCPKNCLCLYEVFSTMKALLDGFKLFCQQILALSLSNHWIVQGPIHQYLPRRILPLPSSRLNIVQINPNK